MSMYVVVRHSFFTTLCMVIMSCVILSPYFYLFFMLMLFVFCFFFFELYVAPRYLHVLTHSFPTRRSSDLEEGSSIVEEGPCGPILPIIRDSDGDDVIARANASPFALGGSVWSSDPQAAAKVALRLDSGSVWVNQHCALDPLVPFPANKQSGFGVEGGLEGLYPYTALQTLNVAKSA